MNTVTVAVRGKAATRRARAFTVNHSTFSFALLYTLTAATRLGE